MDGSVLTPKKEDPLYHAWRCFNTLVIAWTRNLVNPTIADSVLYIKQANDVWTDLRTCFALQNTFRMAEIQKEIAILKQGTMIVTEFFYSNANIME